MAGNKIKIIAPGFCAALRDFGRYGFQNIGIAPCGVSDEVSAAMANMLAGNPRNAAVLEFCFSAPLFSFERKTLFAVAGGDFAVSVAGKEYGSYQTICADAGSEISIKAGRVGLYGYIAVAGGFDAEEKLGSKTTDTKCALGGFEGRLLKKGDEIGIGKPSGENLYSLPLPLFAGNRFIAHVVEGPEEELLNEEDVEKFYGETYEISAQCDRMGMRLSGPKLDATADKNIISDATPTGTIQVTGDGTPIILIADRQTTGGYAKIAVVASYDLPRLTQLRPGAKLRFKKISVPEAQKKLREQSEWLDGIEEELEKQSAAK